MATLNNRERIGRAFELLSEGLHDFVDQVMTSKYRSAWDTKLGASSGIGRTSSKNDPAIQLKCITDEEKLFRTEIGYTAIAYASELREVRNLWAHLAPFSTTATLRALDTMVLLLRAVDSVDSANDVRKLYSDLQRQAYEASSRKKAKVINDNQVSLKAGNGLKPWREVIQPHDDVIEGRFNASEFAADLYRVHTGDSIGSEYANPQEFFNRTYLTEGLKDLLARAVRRIGGDPESSPVINLQTNFGGGKTHSMLALYHLFSGIDNDELPQDVQDVINENGGIKLAQLKVKRVVLVGNYLQPGSTTVKEDGTEINTIWGELAWQLGGAEAYQFVADADRTRTNPGNALYELLKKYSPALILIDEWVTYARQLVDKTDLPAGDFGTQFTFAQTLTETVKQLPGVMLLISVPASEDDEDAINDIEVGGSNGKQALERLQNIVRRVADQWRPSTKNESFEIVRRRLFKDVGAEGLEQISITAKLFETFYQHNLDKFPREVHNDAGAYTQRIKASYPLHPELLDRLYEDWSTLERFQRTRGVLKTVSAIVHELWNSNNTDPMIMCGSVPLSAPIVNTELTQYLSDAWKAIIDSDIDGADSNAAQADKKNTNLGSRFVTQRIARTIFMGAAPRLQASRKGLDKQYMCLGTAVPGDTLGNFKSAITALSQVSTYFYEEQDHYWFDTQASVSKTASDYAERLREQPEVVYEEIIRRLQSQQRRPGSFARVVIAPEKHGEISDTEDLTLVFVHPQYRYSKDDGNESVAAGWVAEAIENRGTGQRVYRNQIVFAVAERKACENLEAGVRQYLGWKQVQNNAEQLDLSVQQTKQVADWVKKTDQTVSDRLATTYGWMMYPEQFDPAQPFTLGKEKIGENATESIAERITKKLKSADLLIDVLAPQVLGMTLQDQLAAKWQTDGEITVGELWEYFTRFPFLSRLANRGVLDSAVYAALQAVMLDQEAFAIALGKNQDTGGYHGLIIPPSSKTQLQVTDSTILVEMRKAKEHFASQQARQEAEQQTNDGVPTEQNVVAFQGESIEVEAARVPSHTRYFGSVELAEDNYASMLGSISQEIVAKLAASGAKVQITLEIQAVKADGFSANDVRTITENGTVLRLRSQGFE